MASDIQDRLSNTSWRSLPSEKGAHSEPALASRSSRSLFSDTTSEGGLKSKATSQSLLSEKGSDGGLKSRTSRLVEHARVQDFLHQTGLQKKVADDHCHVTSSWYYIKHVGFNNIEITEGKTGKGPLAWYVDVRSRIVGWSIIVRRPDGTPIMHLKKEITFARLLAWDKNTTVEISEATADKFGSSNADFSLATTMKKFDSKASFDKAKRAMALRFAKTKKALPSKEHIEGEPKDGEVIIPDDTKDAELAQMDPCEVAELPARKITTLHRKHAFRSNANEFVYEGKVYEWNYWIFLGSTLKLTEKATGEVLAEVQLMPTWRLQIIYRWSWRLDGVLEIKDHAKRMGMQDIIVTTLTAMLEWRKHNNKVWIVAAAIA